MDKVPIQLATLCYLRDQGKTLMIHRNKREDDFHFDKWNGVGGKCDPSESPRNCAMREILEETGYTVQNLHLNGTLYAPLFDGKKDWFIFVYTGRGIAGELIHPPEGTLYWVADEDLLKLNLWEGDTHFLPWILEGKVFESTFWYKDAQYQRHEVDFLGTGEY